MAEFKKAQAIVGMNEGGYQDDPRDSGNWYKGVLIGTNWGISAPTFAEYLGRSPIKSEMQSLTKVTATAILRFRYWERNHLGELKNQSVANLIYDGVVNHGTNGMRFLIDKAIKTLGGQFNYYELFTPKGIKFLNRFNQRKLFDAIKRARIAKYKNSSKTYYIKGWLIRLSKIRYYAENSISAIWPLAAALMGTLGLVIIIVI